MCPSRRNQMRYSADTDQVEAGAGGQATASSETGSTSSGGVSARVGAAAQASRHPAHPASKIVRMVAAFLCGTATRGEIGAGQGNNAVAVRISTIGLTNTIGTVC